MTRFMFLSLGKKMPIPTIRQNTNMKKAMYVATNIPFIYGTDPGGVRHQWDVRFKDLRDFLFVRTLILCGPNRYYSYTDL